MEISREESNDVTLAALEYLDKIHRAARLSNLYLRSSSDGHFKVTSISVMLSLQFLLYGLFMFFILGKLHPYSQLGYKKS